MDLSFTRRRKGKPQDGTPDLQSLLSAAAARQSASPTARAALSGAAVSRVVSPEDLRIGLFAADRQAMGIAPGSASFSGKSVNPGQR